MRSTSKSGKRNPEAEFSKIDSESMRSIVVDSVANEEVKSVVLSVGLRTVGVKIAFD